MIKTFELPQVVGDILFSGCGEVRCCCENAFRRFLIDCDGVEATNYRYVDKVLWVVVFALN